jgi:hypothetical protein
VALDVTVDVGEVVGVVIRTVHRIPSQSGGHLQM